jgi:predicted phage-related endonuclease
MKAPEPTPTPRGVMLLISSEMEHLVRALPHFSLKQKVDVGAHIHSLLKLCKAIDDSIKADIKVKLHEADGVVNGENMKAILAYHPEQRVDVTALKEERPRIYKQFLKPSEVGVIRYEPR